ncbi:hypothetical protein D3C85_1135340 [compost metagenome]
MLSALDLFITSSVNAAVRAPGPAPGSSNLTLPCMLLKILAIYNAIDFGVKN